MGKKIRCVVWDWNGTLLDDVPVCLHVMNRLLDEFGLPELDEVRYREIFTFPVIDYYRALGFPLEITPFEVISEAFIAGYKEESRVCRLTRGAETVLTAFRSAGIHQILLSASRRDHLGEQTRHLGVDHFFHTQLGLDHIHATSKTALGTAWIQESGFHPDEVVMIGDTCHDIDTAEAMGIRCVVVANGHQSRSRLAAAGGWVISELSEVLTLPEITVSSDVSSACP